MSERTEIERKAEAILGPNFGCHLDFDGPVERVDALIAIAIRTARNEALEEAASHLARFGCFPEASEIRNLKTKD